MKQWMVGLMTTAILGIGALGAAPAHAAVQSTPSLHATTASAPVSQSAEPMGRKRHDRDDDRCCLLCWLLCCR